MKQRLRHGLYYLFVVVVFIPLSLCAIGAVLYEKCDALASSVRRWCFRERYVRIPRNG